MEQSEIFKTNTKEPHTNIFKAHLLQPCVVDSTEEIALCNVQIRNFETHVLKLQYLHCVIHILKFKILLCQIHQLRDYYSGQK